MQNTMNINIMSKVSRVNNHHEQMQDLITSYDLQLNFWGINCKAGFRRTSEMHTACQL
jgi:hypothetical protein